MRLSAEATVADVDEALRLFKVSTLAASQSNPGEYKNLIVFIIKIYLINIINYIILIFLSFLLS
jgi:hypothetical protein